LKEGLFMDGIQQISQSELEVMNIIWQENGTITFAPLMEKLNKMEKTWKTNTVVTFLARLVEKGILSIEKKGRNNIYTAQVSEQDYLANQTRAFLEKMYGFNAKELVASLLKHEYLTAKDIEELAEFWKKGRDAT
jgi:predicted transcriptional regulator